MRFAANTVGILAANFQRCTVDRRVSKGILVTAHTLLSNFRQACALNGGRGAKEELIDKHLLQSNGVENLRAAIALIGGNAHLRHNLKQTLIH